MPAAFASPAASRICQLPLTASTLVGIRTTNEWAAMFTSVCSSAPATGWPVATSSSCACCAVTTSAYWIPAERTLAFAGHSSPAGVAPSVLNVHSAIGTSAFASVFQSTRQYVACGV